MNMDTNTTSTTRTCERTGDFLYASDLAAMFKVGRSKARLMMDVLPSMRIGSKDCIARADLNNYIKEHGGIKVKWPKRRKH
jgi:hypothetical protein